MGYTTRGPVTERLYAVSKVDRQSEWQRAKLEKEKQELQQCTFTPKMVAAKRVPDDYKPIHQRVGECCARHNAGMVVLDPAPFGSHQSIARSHKVCNAA